MSKTPKLCLRAIKPRFKRTLFTRKRHLGASFDSSLLIRYLLNRITEAWQLYVKARHTIESEGEMGMGIPLGLGTVVLRSCRIHIVLYILDIFVALI